MLAGLISVIALVAVQFAVVLHVRNTATAHVIEGARTGARADATPQQGAARASELIGSSLIGDADVPVSARRTSVDGVDVVEVSARIPMPLLGPLGPAEALTVTGQAYAEDQ